MGDLNEVHKYITVPIIRGDAAVFKIYTVPQNSDTNSGTLRKCIQISLIECLSSYKYHDSTLLETGQS